jgi:hypothetical protein
MEDFLFWERKDGKTGDFGLFFRGNMHCIIDIYEIE